MSKIALSGNPSGSGTLTIASPNTNSDRTLTLPDTSATLLTTAGGTLTGGLTMGGLLNLGSTGQIQFPATQNASSNANTLDDYEEGTWTPTAPVGTSVSTATYQKVGNTVFINTFVNVGSNSNGAAFVLTGLPFALATGSASVGCFNNDGRDLYAYLDPNGVFIRDNLNANSTCAALSGDFVAFQMQYIAA
jgi:hypothetical protein